MTTRTFSRALAALTLAALAPLVAACGDDDTGEAETETESEETTTTAADDAADGDDGAEEGAGEGVDLDDPDQAAVAEGWTTVFDSSVAADAKSAYLEDPEAAAPTLTAYASTGESMQGITLEPTAITIDGDTATITYDILFAGTSAYQDQTGEMVRQDGQWKVTTEQFCAFMATARTPCA